MKSDGFEQDDDPIAAVRTEGGMAEEHLLARLVESRLGCLKALDQREGQC